MLIGIVGMYQHNLEREIADIENVRIIRHETQVNINDRVNAILSSFAIATYDIEAFINADIYDDAIVITQTPFNDFDSLEDGDRDYIYETIVNTLNYDALLFISDGPKARTALEYIEAVEVPTASLVNVIRGIWGATSEGL